MKVVPSKTDRIPASRVANKAEVAAFFDVSLTTVHSWIRRGCPVIQDGGRGVSWELDLLAVMQWRYLPEDVEDDEFNPERLPPKDRKDWYDGEKRRREIQESDRELIPAHKYDTELSRAIKIMAAGLETLPDVLERDAGLQPKQLEPVFRVVDGLRETLYQSLANQEPAGAD